MHPIIEFFEKHPWILIAIIPHFAILGAVAYLILLERKVASWVQDRIGPNRVGLGFGIIPWLKDKRMFGLGQPLADGLKFILKEDYRPGSVDRILFTVAPAVMILVVIISIAVLPWGGVHQVTRQVDVSRSITSDPGTLTTEAATAAATPGSPEYAKAVAQASGEVPINGALLDNGLKITAEPAEFDPADHTLIKPARLIADMTYRYAFQAAQLNIGVLFILGVLSLAVYGVVLGGWASNNKYSFLGGLRATAQMISYEIPLGLSVLAIVIMFGTLDLGDIVEKQAHMWGHVIPAWNVFTQPVTFLMFLVCIHAEANRAPFDLAEAEQELVGGYHTEYSAMRFALFFLAEYAGMITTSAVCVALFFGGWHIPWFQVLNGHIDPMHPAVTQSMLICVMRALVFFIKTLAIIFVFMWVRWSLPRFRFDQLMMLAWRAMIPMALGLLLVTAIVVYAFGWRDAVYIDRDGTPVIRYLSGSMALALLAGNVILLVGSLVVSRLIPAPPETNRRVRISNSRFNKTPLPASAN